MSGYENYSRTSERYDATRVPLGVEIIFGCLAKSGRRLEDMVLVDAGCGTGNYAAELVHRVGRIEAVDLNAGMLEKARAKLADAAGQGQVAFHQGSVDALPLDSGSADAIIINQVLHHLNDDSGAGWPSMRSVVTEFFRVLRPGGIVVVNICSQRQLTHGWWYFSLIPEAVARMCERHIPLDSLEQIMTECGFDPTGRFVPVDGVMQGRSYFEPLGPLDPDWRAGDSIWALVSENELQRVLSQVRAMDASGELTEFVKKHDADRREIGQFTFISARKRAD